jgi:uncharacterized protein involved in response to NO
LKVLLPVILLGLGNIGFHLEAHAGVADYSIRVGIAAVLLLLMLIGGRIIPSFTGNWLRRQGEGRMPLPFGRFDMVVLLASAGSLLVWIVSPFGQATSIGLIVSGLLHIGRLARWAGDRTFKDRLVLVLHVAYGFMPLGFVLAGLGAAGIIGPTAGVHAWMTGAAGLMTLAVMTRATLGHTGHGLSASVGTQGVYALVAVAAVARICAAIEPAQQIVLLHIAACAWVLGFAGFAVLYGPLLWRRRHAAA